jgi:predicted amidohydrolase YtcJ
VPEIDLLLSGGRVFTTTGDAPPATAVGVRDGRIVAVGGEEVLDLAGPRTQRVDLAGGMLVPGFQDAHIHPVWGGLDLLRCDLSGLSSMQAYLDRVAGFATAHPDDEWILGAGWSLVHFADGLPRADQLDALVPDRPALLWSNDTHRAWVNSAALLRAGIDAATPDPADGRIVHDQSGAPTGVLLEGAIELVARLLPRVAQDDVERALQHAQSHLHAAGITAWHDAILAKPGEEGEPAEAYLALLGRGELTAKVSGALWWDRERGLEQIPELVARRERYAAGRFRTPAVKLMQDGIIESGTAALLTPYRDPHGHALGDTGLSFIDPAVLAAASVALDAAGFQLHFHGIGDRAVRECLDAVAAARAANGPRAGRHQLSHVQLVDPADIPRFAALDVAVNYQSLWATHEPLMDDHTIPVLGAERTARQYPFGDLHRVGARLAAGSDWPVTSPDPIAGIHVAVNRMLPPGHPDRAETPFLPEQALDLATALRAYTSGAAYVNQLDDTGRIAPGFAADLVVLDRDLFAIPADEIGTARVAATYIDGALTYARD